MQKQLLSHIMIPYIVQNAGGKKRKIHKGFFLNAVLQRRILMAEGSQ